MAIKISEECALRILESIEYEGNLQHLSNDELADILIETIWAELPLMSQESDLLSVVIDRLKGE